MLSTSETLAPVGATEAKNMLALRAFGNTASELTPVTIKKGTQFAFGPVAGGYGYQIYIPQRLQSDNITRHLNKTINIPD